MTVGNEREPTRRKQCHNYERPWRYHKPFKHKGHDPARYAERFERFERDEVIKVKPSFPLCHLYLENAHTYPTSCQGKRVCGRQGHFSNWDGPCRFAWHWAWRWRGTGSIPGRENGQPAHL